MKIGISVGHCVLKSGECTSADGTAFGGGSEYEYCLKLAPAIKRQLEDLGHQVTILRVPDKQVVDLGEEKRYKLKLYNEEEFDLLLELHLNQSQTSRSEGTEVLYVSEEGKKYAQAILDKLAREGGHGIWKRRGVKRRTDIDFLNRSKAVAVQLELFFCTNQSEWRRGQKNKQKAARLIAEAIHSVSA